MPTSTKPREVGTPAVLTKAGSAPRILAADDQQHILEAIELLLKPQGYKVDVVRSPELAREALSSAQYDAVLIDLELHTRHHFGARGPRPAFGNRRARQHSSDHCHDGVGKRRACS